MRPLHEKFHNPNVFIGRETYGDLNVLGYEGCICKLTVGAFCSFARAVTVIMGGEHDHGMVTTFPFHML